MSKTLAERERSFTLGMSPSDRAKRIAPKLRELAAEQRRRAAASGGASAELLELEAVWAEDAADLLRILAQEQWRQREAAKLYLCGQTDRFDLRRVTDTWNEDRP